MKIKDAKHYVEAFGTQDLVVSRFDSKEHGEAYMFVNFGDVPEDINKVEVSFKDCKALALYGGAGFTGEPKIIELDEKGSCVLEFAYGEGAFVVPLAE